MLTLMLILTVEARSIDDVSKEDRLLVECEHVVRKERAARGLEGVADAWKKCLDDATNNGLTDALPALSGRYALAVIERDYGKWKQTNPTGYAEVVLATSAQYPNTKIDTTVLNEQWHVLLADPKARNSLTGLHSIGIRWLPNPNMSQELYQKLKAKLNRSIGDLGLKVPSESSEAMAKTDIMLMIEASARHMEPEVSDERGTIYRFEAQFTSKPVRFKTREKRTPPVTVSHSVSGPQKNALEDKCINEASMAFSELLLREILRVAYSNYRIPAP